jgi:putative phage-type endonuclease
MMIDKIENTNNENRDELLCMYRIQLQKLLKIPKLEQKTPEWYNARHNLITASDFAQALGKGKFGTQKQLIEKKVQTNTDTIKVSNQFFEWGNMFEPVACNVYSAIHNNVTVYEFGLIQHPYHTYFGASPDGITEDGIMLEIKCPLKRKITGEIPLQYYYQIQGQLDVCELRECDYFECEFSKYDSWDDYKTNYQDGSYTGTIKVSEDGFVYPILQTSICSYEDGVKYWILNKFYIQRVIKDDIFVTEKMKELKDVWDKIIYYRNNPDKFKIEIKQKITVDTQELYTSNKVISNNSSSLNNKCMIIDLD